MKKAEIIYDKFSVNLHNICKIWDFELEDRFKDEGYICPLSFKIFTKNGLSNIFDDQLTIEHVPPDSLRGKGLCLTNKISNSTAGHSLDLALQNHIRLKEFNERISPLKTVAYIENVKLEANIDLSNKENPKFQLISKSIHQGNDRIKNKILNDGEFKMRFFIPADNRKTIISLLRTAYLYAFGNVGYSILFGLTKLVNPNYDLIRKQIQNPEDNVIDDIVIFDKLLEDASVGVNIIYEPKEFRSVWVVFPVFSETKEWRYGVFLPGLDDFGFQALKNINEAIKGKDLRFKYYNLPKMDITDINDNKLFYDIWEKHNGIYIE